MHNNGIHLRTPEIHELKEIYEAGNSASVTVIIPPVEWTPELLADTWIDPHGIVTGVFRRKKLLGFAAAACTSSETRIIAMGIIPKLQHKGLEELLIKSIRNSALEKGSDTLTAFTRNDHQTCKTLLEKLGFTIRNIKAEMCLKIQAG